eukprot:TRINITY_DN44234_c0_g2_i1.p1 TRINITY_DN44234_c0_g2~~TRINITY_DN44234_c0_g2_i1.p1  ORF type:complete len:638 (+),score=136.12 TRINITY_DN44234_c0_g2_i1:166-1914(+)
MASCQAKKPPEVPPPELLASVQEQMFQLIVANAQVLAARCAESCVEEVWNTAFRCRSLQAAEVAAALEEAPVKAAAREASKSAEADARPAIVTATRLSPAEREESFASPCATPRSGGSQEKSASPPLGEMVTPASSAPAEASPMASTGNAPSNLRGENRSEDGIDRHAEVASPSPVAVAAVAREDSCRSAVQASPTAAVTAPRPSSTAAEAPCVLSATAAAPAAVVAMPTAIPTPKESSIASSDTALRDMPATPELEAPCAMSMDEPSRSDSIPKSAAPRESSMVASFSSAAVVEESPPSGRHYTSLVADDHGQLHSQLSMESFAAAPGEYERKGSFASATSSLAPSRQPSASAAMAMSSAVSSCVVSRQASAAAPTQLAGLCSAAPPSSEDSTTSGSAAGSVRSELEALRNTVVALKEQLEALGSEVETARSQVVLATGESLEDVSAKAAAAAAARPGSPHGPCSLQEGGAAASQQHEGGSSWTSFVSYLWGAAPATEAADRGPRPSTGDASAEASDGEDELAAEKRALQVWLSSATECAMALLAERDHLRRRLGNDAAGAGAGEVERLTSDGFSGQRALV